MPKAQVSSAYPETDLRFKLNVFREVNEHLERVGSLLTTRTGTSFSYDLSYLESPNAQSVSLSLPLRSEPFSTFDSPSFFEGLLPEGSLRGEFAQAVRVAENFETGMLSQFNNESVGGLVFSCNEEFDESNQAYHPLSRDDLKALAAHPDSMAITLGTASRLSLSGAQTKAGLYHQAGAKEDEGWFLPEGSAPSNTIVKASSGKFPLQTLNEAFCLTMAQRCGFDTAAYSLIPSSNGSPLIAITRFDRVIDEHAALVGGLSVPTRLHQEDFCQAAGLPSFFKYEPTDGRYLELGSRILSRSSTNPFGDRMVFLNRLLFDFLIGNCDNHLKNHSIVWSRNWKGRELSPLYDITCTTMYPFLDREMGVSLCASRRIDDVTSQDICGAFRRAGVSERLGWSEYQSLCERFQAALPLAEQDIVDQGFPEASEVARFIAKDSAPRCHLR